MLRLSLIYLRQSVLVVRRLTEVLQFLTVCRRKMWRATTTELGRQESGVLMMRGDLVRVLSHEM